MRLRLCVAALAVLVVGCGSQDEPAHFDADTVGLVFTPDPGAEEATGAALDRLSAATGLAFEAGPNGVPVGIVDQVQRFDGDAACGVTLIGLFVPSHGVPGNHIDSVEIQLAYPAPTGCWVLADTLAHEMIHALRRKTAAPGTELSDHTKHGLFQLHENADTKLDAQSLTKICEAVDCALFQPEQ